MPLSEPNGASSLTEGCEAEAWHWSRMDGVSLSEVHSTIFGSLTAWSVMSLVWCKLAGFTAEAEMASTAAWYIFLNNFPFILPYFCLFWPFWNVSLVHMQGDVCKAVLPVSPEQLLALDTEMSVHPCHPKDLCSSSAWRAGACCSPVCLDRLVRYSGPGFTHSIFKKLPPWCLFPRLM